MFFAYKGYNISMKNVIVLLDSYSLLYRAYYAIQTVMTDKNGRPLNAVFGFTNMLLRIIDEIKPTHMVATFDCHGPTFRHKSCDYYKATRKPMPEDLRPQVGAVRELLTAMGIKIVELQGYEGDDMLGTLSKKLEGDKYIITGDRDSLQLVSEDTRVWLTKRGITDVVEYDLDRLSQEGLKPYQIIELKALMGDTSDNIKGVPGIGEKTAKTLIETYDTIENLYLHVDELKGKMGEKIRAGKSDAEESKYLATIDCNAPINVEIDELTYNPFSAVTKSKLEEFEFRSIIKRINFADDEGVVSREKISVESKKVLNIDDVQGLEQNTTWAVYFDDNEIRLSNTSGVEYILPICKTLLDEGVYLEDTLKEIKNKNLNLILHDAKKLMHAINCEVLSNNGYFDTQLASYLLNAQKSYEKVQEIFDDFSSEDYGENTATALFFAGEELKKLLVEQKLDKLFYNVEQPLTAVLFDMERTGFCVDTDMLSELRERYASELSLLEEKIYDLAGEKFNINSPKQLSNILYVKLGLPVQKKNKSGASTSAEALDGLKGKHEIVDYLLRFRQISKLKSTYIEGIDGLLDKTTGRVHTVFKQTATVTGRLSSTEPNLQNIPVRTEEGRELRKMFKASRGQTLVCADYSQIELRLLAAFSLDDKLVSAYKSGEDIHSATASAVYGVDINDVTQDMRRSAKAVNFGIIYGISDYGLATELGIYPKHAKYFIERYFETYPSVKTYMEKNVEDAKSTGKSVTLLGRVRKIPELLSSNYNIRSFGERAAMNMPLQGSAADIIKLSMLRVFDELKKAGLKAKLILQVHDELIIDSPLNEVEKVKEILKKGMEEAVSLEIPLVADIGEGENWFIAK